MLCLQAHGNWIYTGWTKRKKTKRKCLWLVYHHVYGVSETSWYSTLPACWFAEYTIAVTLDKVAFISCWHELTLHVKRNGIHWQLHIYSSAIVGNQLGYGHWCWNAIRLSEQIWPVLHVSVPRSSLTQFSWPHRKSYTTFI